MRDEVIDDEGVEQAFSDVTEQTRTFKAVACIVRLGALS